MSNPNLNWPLHMLIVELFLNIDHTFTSEDYGIARAYKDQDAPAKATGIPFNRCH